MANAPWGVAVLGARGLAPLVGPRWFTGSESDAYPVEVDGQLPRRPASAPGRCRDRQRPLLVSVAAVLLTLALIAACSSSTPAVSGTPTPSPTVAGGSGSGFHLPVNHPTVWLCRPGMTNNVCAGDLDATVLAPDGTRSTEVFRPAANPKIDCFYV